MILSTPPYSSNLNDVNSINSKIESTGSPPAPLKRKNTFQIKQKLSEVLGPNSQEYWNCLKNYLMGKLSKYEFDKSIKSLIGDQLPLHNSLIYSIIYNSQRDIVPNDGSLHPHLLTNQDSKDRNSLKRKHKFNNKTGAKRMKLKDEFLSLEKIDRDKIRGLIKKFPNPKNQIPTFSSHYIIKPPKDLPPSFRDNPPSFKDIPPSFKDIQDVPGINDSLLKERVEFVASLEGINNVTDEALVLISYALRSRLKGIIENCLYKRIENEEELETPVTPVIPYRLSTAQRSTTYNESDRLINQQPLPHIITTDTSTSLNNNNIINNVDVHSSITVNTTANTNDKKENENNDTEVNKENIDSNTKEQQLVKDTSLSSIISNNSSSETSQNDLSNSLLNINMFSLNDNSEAKTEDKSENKTEVKMDNEPKKATENQEKKDDSSESNNKDSTIEESTKDSNNNTNASLSANPNNTTDISETKGSSLLLREKILKVRASLQKKLKEEGQTLSSNVMDTMKPGVLLCERGGFIEISKKLSNGIKPNSNVSIANLNTLPLTNLSSEKQRNMAEALSKFYAKGSLETIRESEDESPTTNANTNAQTKTNTNTTTNTLTTTVNTSINKSITPTSATSVLSNPLASSTSNENNTSLLNEVKQETEERNGFSNIIQNHKEDDLFNMLLSSNDIISHHDFVGTGSFNPSLANSTAANTPAITPPSLASAIVHSSGPTSSLAIKSDHLSTTPNILTTAGGHASTSTPSSSTTNKKLILTNEPSSSLGNKSGKGRDCNEDEVFAEFDVDANLSQRHLISLQDIFFAHEINPQHIFNNSSYSSEVLENLICVLAENDHSIIE